MFQHGNKNKKKTETQRIKCVPVKIIFVPVLAELDVDKILYILGNGGLFPSKGNKVLSSKTAEERSI